MIGSDDLLRAYLQLIHRVSGARGVSLYLPTPAGPAPPPVLVHEGEAPAIPELADLEAAEGFRRQAESELAEAGAGERRDWLTISESAVAGGCLIRIPTLRTLMSLGHPAAAPPPAPGRRRSDADAAGIETLAAAWLGLRFGDGGERLRQMREAVAPVGEPGERPGWWPWLFAVGGALAWHTQRVVAILQDPISRLPGRAELQAILRQSLELMRVQGRPVALLLINPDEFALVNERLGREAGDAVIREIAEQLAAALRRSDFIARYGGAVFAVVLPGSSAASLSAVAAKIHRTLTEEAYCGGAVRLGFSFGVATLEAAAGDDLGEAALELIRRGDQALNAAKLAGGDRIVVWRPGAQLEEVGNRDRLSGIFTANLSKDYRNMLLLWDTIGIVAASAEVDRLLAHVVERISATFRPLWTGFVHRADEESGVRPATVAKWPADGPRSVAADLESTWGGSRRALVAEAWRSGEPASAKMTAAGAKGEMETRALAIPVTAGDRCLGCLYLEGEEESLRLGSSDLIFLQALSGQLAVALDRARLAEQERGRQEAERLRLRSELHELRQTLQQAKLVFQSAAMEGLLATAHRAAATDATVLITGESGTGKELLARTIHQLSPRRQRPLALVDLTAIATTLMDRELFGHEKGAFTGAVQRSPGRLAQVDGGTVLLDEIGEVPLEVQSKLLRFVQERQITPVGGNRPRVVDVRIIAVTNRDLKREVEAGRFREDLYYRLNVVRLEVPPLRDRPDDVLALARHFLMQFSLQYQKRVPRLSRQAEELLTAYRWPGNVRELQNRILRAVVLSAQEEIGAHELGLASGDEMAPEPPAASAAGRGEEAAAAAGADGWSPGRDPWAALRLALRDRLAAVATTRPSHPEPLGTWLAEDLVLAAERATPGLGRAAALLGVPDTTFRRRLLQARTQAETGRSPRPADWTVLRSQLDRLLSPAPAGDEDLLRRLRRVLLEEVAATLPGETAVAAAVMGVTVPTYRRWLADSANRDR